MEVVILTVVLILCTLVWYRSRRPLNYPPGPTPWPVIGNISTMADPDILKVMKNIRGAYGDIFTLSIGCYWVIVANGTKTIHELLVKNADYTSDRPDMLLFRMLKNKGIVSTNGATWKHQRAFTHSKLRLFGFGKVSFEEKITEELACFLNFMESNLEITDFSNELFASIVNNILSITIGRRLEYDDSRLLDIIERNNDNAKNFAVSGLGNFIPFLARIPGDPLKINRFQQNTDFCKDFFMEEVSEHKKQFDKNDKRDFIDVYLDEIDQHKKSGNPYDENHLTAILFELFGAGGETTVSTIKWAILYMINNPEIQTKMRKEISDVVGLNRLPRLADRSEMHYSEAVILETLRISTMSVLSIPHSISETFEFRGFTLPKNAVLLLNYDSVAFDEDLFPDSHVFRPERFIGSDGKVKGQEDVPVFSTGRRKCPGETLARMSLFLYLTSMLQRFEFIPVDVNKPPSLKSQYGISNSPVDFQCRMNVIDNQTNVGK